MTIEVKEMIIKTIVTDKPGARNQQNQESLGLMLEQLKSEVLTECRNLLMDMLNEQGMR